MRLILPASQRAAIALPLLFHLHFLLLGFSTAHAQNNKLILQPGSNFVASGGNVVMNNTDVKTDGAFNSNGAVLLITGSNNTAFSGATPLQASTLQLNTGAASTLTLSNTLKISNAFIFQNGRVDCNNNQLQLAGSAVLQGENETNRVIAPSGGFAIATATGVNNPFQFNAGNLGAVLTSTTNLGNLSVTRFGKPATNPGNASMHGIQRTYLIQPQNNVALNATLRFYYLNAELNGDDPNTLTLWKSNDGIAWTKVGFDSRSTVNKYVEKTAIADFSYWTLTDLLNALPLTLISFSAKCATSYTQLQWQTGIESDMDHFDIERSTDGNSWTKIGEVPCSNSATGSTYGFKDNAALPDALYRLKIISLSATVSYSPVFKGGCADIAMPFMVYPNPATAKAVAQVSVRDAANANLKVMNTAGQIVYSAQWKLSPGINQHLLPVTSLATGTYFIQLELNQSVLQSTFLKQ
ncbi:MAG: T9SS type A sorting domain-containing protein [Chitinophagaceae bacterium]